MREFIQIYSTQILIVLIAIFALFFFFFDGVPFIFSDGYGYYHSAKSLTEEGSFVSQEIPDYIQYAGHGVDETTEGYSNRYAPGSSLLFSPILYLLKPLDNGSIYTNYHKAFNGHSFEDGLGILIFAFASAISSFMLIYKSQVKLGVKENLSIISTTSAFIGLIALPYIFEFSSFPHIYEILAASIMLFIATTKFVNNNVSFRSIIIFSVAFSISILIKNVNLIILAPIAFYFYKPQSRKDISRSYIGGLLVALTIGVLFGLIQLKYNYDSYGAIFFNSYESTAGESFTLNIFILLNLLFSDIRGWFIYSPIALVSIFVLSMYSFRSLKGERGFYLIALLLPIITAIVLYGAWPAWWAGESLGQRYLLITLPMIAVGIGLGLKQVEAISDLRKRRILYLCFAILILYSGIITVFLRITPVNRLDQYIGMHDSNPLIVDEEEYGISDIIRFQNYAIRNPQVYKESLNGGRSLTLIWFGLEDTIVKLESVNENEFRLRVLPNSKPVDIVGVLEIEVEYKGSTFSTEEEVNLSEFQRMEFECNDERCTIDDQEMREARSQKELESYIQLSSDIRISVSSNNEGLNLVDYKLQ